MPGTKKTSMAATRKKVKASARARISTRKITGAGDKSGSYLANRTLKTASKQLSVHSNHSSICNQTQSTAPC